LASFLCCSVSASTAADYSYPATYTGSTAAGGTVEFEVASDGKAVTRFEATQVPDTCGVRFDGTAEGAFAITGEAFSNEGPGAGLQFSGIFPAAGHAEGTVSYRIFDLRYDGCESETVGWTASKTDERFPPPQVVPTYPDPPTGGAGEEPGHMNSAVRRGLLVVYRQEGGIGGPRPSLLVSTDRRAKVRLGSCTARFRLRQEPWRRLRSGLGHADLEAVAGNYPPPPGSADAITYVIKARAGTVRIAPAPEPRNEEVMRDLGPVLKALNGVVSAGERRMSPSCQSGH
jgi:hypothetical protein